jgi:hypothetical protein
MQPHIYHLAEAENWPRIQQYGLLSAHVLLEQAKLAGKERYALEHEQRRSHTTLANGVQIRDQKPMPPAALVRCLIGMTPQQWYAWINSHVFFWFDYARLNRQRAACGPRPQVALTIDAQALIAAYQAHIALTPINTGNARRQPALRSRASFVPYATWLDSRWDTEAQALGTTPRKRSHAPVELTVRNACEIKRFVVSAQALSPGQAFLPRV